MSTKNKISLTEVGIVKNAAEDSSAKEKQSVSQIIVKPEFTAALDGISSFSHLFILFWLNKITSEERKTLKVHPRGRKDLPLLGVFATRSKFRPNPIGLTLVELVKVEGNILTVRGLDAFDGTPVLDIKPADPWDLPKDIKVPHWWHMLEKEKSQCQ
ncbi:MAG: tRNA (N6-threonylcarbamoyladenosine(37)-N6)-methyltransferase TrmO [Candidatus Bathyarchaeia archaeon]